MLKIGIDIRKIVSYSKETFESGLAAGVFLSDCQPSPSKKPEVRPFKK